jgi:tetratricopeptide (TPR) repeat protein
MQRHTIELFQKTPGIVQLRFLSPKGNLIGEREHSLQEIIQFAEIVEQKHQISRSDPTGSLPKLGKELYEWLDGPTTRWLAEALNSSGGFTLQIDFERLLQLPWELLHSETGYLCSNPYKPFTPARLVVNAKSGAPEIRNRPLRMLFMACSPEDVKPLLDFETEEGVILDSARQHHIELVVEESGTLGGLEYQVKDDRRGYFDVLHLTGHADVKEDGPFFVMENDQGMRQDVLAGKIAEAFQENWPRLVFLSGCKTGQSHEQDQLPSLCEALVRVGAPAVLGWAQPVYDTTANLAAGELYGHLAAGKSIDEAVALARLHLYGEGLPDWHLLRLYTDGTLPGEIVTAPETPDRAQLSAREAAIEFLDAGAQTEICKREDFVGRRRIIQRCLRTLQSQEGNKEYAEGVLLHGMGGLGKSSLAARLCERLSKHKRVVIVGALDELGLINKISDALNDAMVIKLVNDPKLPLKQRLRNLFCGPLSIQPIIFVLDDFEQNLERSSNEYVVKPEPLEVLELLLTAIRESVAESRVIVTCRYQFPLSPPLRLRSEGLETLRGGELDKKLNQLGSFGPNSQIKEGIRKRAKALGAGNPRLLEWLNKLLMDGATDADSILDAMERETKRFRETVLIRGLLDQLSPECRRTIALASVYELPFDRQAIAVAVGGSLDPQFERAVSLGLVESGIEPAMGEPRYFISRIVLPLIESEVSAEGKIKAASLAAKHLHQTRWQSGAVTGLIEAREILRLAILGREAEITKAVGGWITAILVSSNRYREAKVYCQAALSLIEDHLLLLNLARAQVILGGTGEALKNYEKALSICPDLDVGTKSGIVFNLATLVAQQGNVKRALGLWQQSLAHYEQIGDARGKAATLHQMAGVIAQQGDIERALDLWRQSLALKEQIGDARGEAATLHNMAGVIADQGDVKRALDLWRQSLGLKEQIGDARGKAATLHQMAGVISQQGDVEGALGLWRQSLALYDQIGDVQGKAATLHQMAGVIAQQGNVEGALELWQQSLAVDEQIGDVQGKARTHSNMAGVIAQQGDVECALDLWRQSLALYDQIGDVQGKAATLHNMAGVIAQQGDVECALDLWRQSLALKVEIGDTRGKAATLHQMAGVIAQQGNVERALELWQQSLALEEEIGDVKGKAATLHNIAGMIADQGDVERALDLWRQSLALKEQIGDVQGRAATLHQMAGVIADQGDVKRALDLWQQSLALLEQIGDVQGKAATLHNMAGVIAQQGDVKRALDLWRQSLTLKVEIGDVQGKAATLSMMAWMAGEQKDFEEARRLYFEAGKSLRIVQSWLNLITVLSNLSTLPIDGANEYHAQAVWLTIRVEAPAHDALNLIAKILSTLGVEHEIAPLLAAAALFIAQTRGQNHPEQVMLVQYAMDMLGICAEARKNENQEQFQEWFVKEGLNDPNRFLPRLSSALESMVSEEEWLFDRDLFQ